ncbi:MAG: hypothetical protein JRI34_02610 [Deltaproteobacteria bacterium]|nr:hypothetical protein [Deltaproteobacteria bacterium]
MSHDQTSFMVPKADMTDEEYKALWRKTGPIEIKMIEQTGECRHNLHDTFYYKTPYEKPKGVCTALLHVLDFYTWRVVLGFPSWYEDDRSVYRIHCPDRTGTVWEMRKADRVT